MGDSRAAAGTDRLPWLADEPKKSPPARRGRKGELAAWATAALLVIAGTSFWIGTRSQSPVDGRHAETARSSSTIPLPQPQPAPQEVRIAPQPQVTPSPAPEVRQTPVREVHFVAPPARKSETKSETTSVSEAEAASDASQTTESKAAPQSSPARPEVLKPWSPRLVDGAAGRLVEIGAFGSVPQAKLGWRYMVRAYPAVAHLPALVRPDRNSKGRTFYRFRVGTTSQAHSEVLCQRMGKIHLSCAVVGLPWKSKVER
jgi:outer membrane biosynthesis protein TonB